MPHGGQILIFLFIDALVVLVVYYYFLEKISSCFFMRYSFSQNSLCDIPNRRIIPTLVLLSCFGGLGAVLGVASGCDALTSGLKVGSGLESAFGGIGAGIDVAGGSCG